jgi:hypothetical protein
MNRGTFKLFKTLGILFLFQSTLLIAEVQNISNEHLLPSKTSTVVDKKGNIDTNKLDEFAFDIIKKGTDNNNTFLIVGGIQGDEPGGFMAASLISSHYDIQKGSVWIVPNLNFYSIIKSGRAPFGDMNRKFATLPANDPEYKIVERVKEYIANENVKLILNLHDGSGFYRPMYIDKMHQPLRWGQTIVIDQELLHEVDAYSDLYTISEQVIEHTNKFLLKDEDEYRTKNTHTRFQKTFEEQEMSKTLTYYAITHGKAAFGHETSKSLSTNERVYYKLLAIEKFMDIMGIEYKRNFELTLDGINKALMENIDIVFEDTNVKMPLQDIRNIQKYFPVNDSGVIKYFPSNPLLKIIQQGKTYTIYYGNKVLTKLEADYIEHLNFNTEVKMVIDGALKNVKFGDTIEVKNNFLVKNNKSFRVNVIGYKSKSGKETDLSIKKEEFDSRYSVEKNGSLFRIEFYKEKKFVGMILVNYLK